MRDQYKILGVPRNANRTDIDKAYHKLKAKFSSEDLDDPYFRNLYRKIIEAYNILSNENLRANYDRKFKREDSTPLSKPIEKIELVPVINYFRANVDTLKYEENISLDWKTTNADLVVIEPLGKVEATGSREFQQKDQGKKDVVFTLKATNSISGESLSRTLIIKNKSPEISPSYPSEPKNSEAKSQSIPKAITSSPEKNIKKETENKVKKQGVKMLAIPGGALVFVLLIIFFFVGRRDFFQTEKQDLIQEILPEQNSPVISVLEAEESIEVRFNPISEVFNGSEVVYYDIDDILEELIFDLKANARPNLPGFNADMLHFFNDNENPVQWENSGRSGDSYLYTYDGAVNIGFKQESFYGERSLILDKLDVKKYGKYKDDSWSLQKLSFMARDSGPPFWSKDASWKGLENLFNNRFKNVVLLERTKNGNELLHTINNLDPGEYQGYVTNEVDQIIPVSIIKDSGDEVSSSLEVSFHNSMNSLYKNADNEDFTPEEKIINLSRAEDQRDFYLVSSFYADEINIYWETENISNYDLREMYEGAWNTTEYSKNNILFIKVLDEQNFDVEIEFSYVDKKSGDTISQISTNRYIFNNEGLITEVYGIISNPNIAEPKISSDKKEMDSGIIKTKKVSNSYQIENTIGEVPFTVVENVPIFPGCEKLGNNNQRKKCMSEKIDEFVRKNFNSDLGSQLGLTGITQVMVQFKIDKEGNVTDVRSRAPHPRLEQEAARVINSLPKMIPGKQRGKTVGVMYSLPIVFQVQD